MHDEVIWGILSPMPYLK